MLLREFVYFNPDEAGIQDKNRYDAGRDNSVLHLTDLRKSRLTLRMLNDLRKSGDAREKESKDDLDLVKKMYSTPKPTA